AQSDKNSLTEETLAQFLDTHKNNIPDPDLIIRTSGEKRLSGLFSWQSAYSELYFSDKQMPDWSGEDLELAVQDYYHRQRRYGK
ncbi:MAG: isoprenyl transferase, partial [Candidatus Moranbacteria bacterium]|nr:isoprenyl transferase [Candidatus Moranbacteria bacterium]